jgi:sugar O-acyltransferase (sialic acid O-acetyltransferase NeuD family)
MENIIIIGSSGHAAVVIDAIECLGHHRIVGLVDASRAKGDRVFGYQILGNDTNLSTIIAERAVTSAVVAIGDNFLRSQVVEKIAQLCPQLGFASIAHPRAFIAHTAVLGAGTVVFAGATVNAGATIGRHCIVNTNASVDHFSQLNDFVSLAPNAATGGNVTIGRHSAIGQGANIIQGRRIGDQTVIGAGATVLHDIGSFLVAYGTPACEIRKREPGESYL